MDFWRWISSSRRSRRISPARSSDRDGCSARPRDLDIGCELILGGEAAVVGVVPVAEVPEDKLGRRRQPALLDRPVGGTVAHGAAPHSATGLGTARRRGLSRLLLTQPVADGFHPVEHLAPYPDAGRTEAAGLPALQGVDRQAEFLGQFDRFSQPVSKSFSFAGARALRGFPWWVRSFVIRAGSIPAAGMTQARVGERR